MLDGNWREVVDRGLVFVDGVDGSVVASHTELNPEDWATDT